MLKYDFEDSEKIYTPALVYYYEGIKNNIDKMIYIAEDTNKLWPHVKTFKCAEVVKMQMDAGIYRFKCATISEAEMVAECHAKHVLLAYPLVGPTQERFLKLVQRYPETTFWALGDNEEQLQQLGELFEQNDLKANVLLDVNPGLNRTGVLIENLYLAYKKFYQISGIKLRGIHCYDGQCREHQFEKRYREVLVYAEQLKKIREDLKKENYLFDTFVAGTTPSFPCYVKLGMDDIYYSPGTLVINDYGYSTDFPDLQFEPAAAILTRVISNPIKGYFTLDLGVKGLAADPGIERGLLLDMPNAEPVFQNEEHWVYKMKEGYEEETPKIGTQLFVIPTHICPTCALYAFATVIKAGKVYAEWKIVSRDRKITI